MKKLTISQAALFLEEYLTHQIQHPTNYESQADMFKGSDEVTQLLSSKNKALSDTPFPLALTLLQNPNLESSEEAQLDDFQLLNACRSHLSLMPITEISPTSIEIYASLLTRIERNHDSVSALRAVVSVMNRSENLEAQDESKMRHACSNAFKTFREAGLVNDEIERYLDQRISREKGKIFVNELGFNPANIQSLRGIKMDKGKEDPKLSA